MEGFERLRAEGEVLRGSRDLTIDLPLTCSILTIEENSRLSEILSMNPSKERDEAIHHFLDSTASKIIDTNEIDNDTRIKIINELKDLIGKFCESFSALMFWLEVHTYEAFITPSRSLDITKRFLDKLPSFEVPISFYPLIIEGFSKFWVDVLAKDRLNYELEDAYEKSFALLNRWLDYFYKNQALPTTLLEYGDDSQTIKDDTFPFFSIRSILTPEKESNFSTILAMQSSKERDIAIGKFFDSAIVEAFDTKEVNKDTRLAVLNEFKKLIETFHDDLKAICFWLKMHGIEVSTTPSRSPDITRRFLAGLANFEVPDGRRFYLIEVFFEFVDNKLEQQAFSLEIQDAAIKTIGILENYLEGEIKKLSS